MRLRDLLDYFLTVDGTQSPYMAKVTIFLRTLGIQWAKNLTRNHTKVTILFASKTGLVQMHQSQIFCEFSVRLRDEPQRPLKDPLLMVRN